ncbi:MAG: NapC/NirT family cytochrome c [Planctomycetota bacterium]
MNRFLLLLRSNWLTWTGAILTTVSFMAFVTSLVYFAMYGAEHGAYAGLFVFVLVPFLFVLGILLIPLGLWFYRKQLPERMAAVQERPLKMMRLLGILTLVNLAVVGTAGFQAVHYMDSQAFCGTLCHEVMSPTYEASLDSPHAKVACVECHIGTGTASFIRAKVNGMRQLALFAMGKYSKPIPAPVHTMRPAIEICGHCHWPQREIGDRVIVRPHYNDDDPVTPAINALTLHVGGGDGGNAHGIHWHADPATKVSYVSHDGKRDKIQWIRYTDKEGKERVFTAEGEDLANPPPAESWRTMDCIDCHNQPSHNFQLPDKALDAAIAAGKVSRQLPGIRRRGLELLRQEWKRETAQEEIVRALEQAYAGDELAADVRAQVQPAAAAIAGIWLRNVYPSMNITWGTYPNFSGHVGCMRCHDGEHMDEDGEAINMECASCHTMLAEKEADPEIVRRLGLVR